MVRQLRLVSETIGPSGLRLHDQNPLGLNVTWGFFEEQVLSLLKLLTGPIKGFKWYLAQRDVSSRAINALLADNSKHLVSFSVPGNFLTTEEISLEIPPGGLPALKKLSVFEEYGPGLVQLHQLLRAAPSLRKLYISVDANLKSEASKKQKKYKKQLEELGQTVEGFETSEDFLQNVVFGALAEQTKLEYLALVCTNIKRSVATIISVQNLRCLELCLQGDDPHFWDVLPAETMRLSTINLGISPSSNGNIYAINQFLERLPPGLQELGYIIRGPAAGEIIKRTFGFPLSHTFTSCQVNTLECLAIGILDARKYSDRPGYPNVATENDIGPQIFHLPSDFFSPRGSRLTEVCFSFWIQKVCHEHPLSMMEHGLQQETDFEKLNWPGY
ncbi:hypothetical protein ABW21_db0200632 [Orbilia brochopaga]|nr:hypothetical protein ABW21_db0200632 [Drechslerella brochopaga]